MLFLPYFNAHYWLLTSYLFVLDCLAELSSWWLLAIHPVGWIMSFTCKCISVEFIFGLTSDFHNFVFKCFYGATFFCSSVVIKEELLCQVMVWLSCRVCKIACLLFCNEYRNIVDLTDTEYLFVEDHESKIFIFKALIFNPIVPGGNLNGRWKIVFISNFFEK